VIDKKPSVGLKNLPLHEECHFRKNIYLTPEAQREIFKSWLSQANHVMDKSGLDAGKFPSNIISVLGSMIYPLRYILYVTVCAIHKRLTHVPVIIDYLSLHFLITSNLDPFTLQGTFMANTSRGDVYLFLPPADVDDSGGHLAVHLPLESETYYWSLDPDGIERLPQDALEELALPHIKWWTQIHSVQWSKEVYDSITKFYGTKNFGPTSQDIAIELRYPLVDVDRLINLIYCDAVSLLFLAVQCKH
jgi:hypothetical protein